MKANLENLKDAMQRCAQAHSATFCDWSEDDQLAIDKANVPTMSDVRMICEAFFGTFSPMDEDCGYTVVWLDVPFLQEVNVQLLNMALPMRMAMEA
jgi:hypothetical protein